MAMAGGASMEVVDQHLPGFRFHPTEDELLDFYLSRVVHGQKLHFDIIGTLNIYRHDPWDLPGMAKIGEREWYFFVPRDRKAGSGGRPNRTTERGFWKATGLDRAIRSSADANRVIGLKKTLVFYRGRAPRGTKTDWVMNEYRLPEFGTGRAAAAPPKKDMVLCKIYRKATPLKELEQRASDMEEMQRRSNVDYTARASLVRQAAAAGDNYLSSDDVHDSFLLPSSSSSAPSGDSYNAPKEAKKEADAVTVASTSLPQEASQLPRLQLPAMSHGVLDLPSLQVPTNHGLLDWMQDPFQLRSPWQDQLFLSPLAYPLF
ncbi:NAC domain-containing protein 22-like [Phragmites australis]|uniref:NAC domain-containing protein 22-like n=1 Tax=Phragmites australis TaxID=29695 RepID=UPI002D77EF26|nr:NAC domain-containing protein 22-like [Phragmites australis]